MTVAELITELQNMPENAPVHFAYCYGDHWRTQVAPEVNGVELGNVEHSSYHDMPKVIEDDDEDRKAPTVVILQ